MLRFTAKSSVEQLFAQAILGESRARTAPAPRGAATRPKTPGGEQLHPVINAGAGGMPPLVRARRPFPDLSSLRRDRTVSAEPPVPLMICVQARLRYEAALCKRAGCTAPSGSSGPYWASRWPLCSWQARRRRGESTKSRMQARPCRQACIIITTMVRTPTTMMGRLPRLIMKRPRLPTPTEMAGTTTFRV